MSAEDKMNFYRSYYELADLAGGEKSRRAVLAAMLDLFFTGVVGFELTQREEKALNAVRGRIEASRVNAGNRRGRGAGIGGADETANGTGNETANESRNETDNETRNETANETRNGSRNETGIGDAASVRGRQRLPLCTPPSQPKDVGHRDVVEGRRGCEPPTLEEARAYFGANGLRGDADAFWANYESSKVTAPDGSSWWVKGRDGSVPVTDWRPLAVKWASGEARFEPRAGRGGRRGQETVTREVADDTARILAEAGR